ncbi:MAG: 6-bladed beta-propeller [Candidatus Eisenbacteria bacterium]|uniref:6-bladed beta-propeller n=1 Tax=Eiseniibacteriota bacterium TaxID=2212470 RepID=A0A538TKZ7_UNCEI|nr:MAG: 6-bladed beta-propeller [Candidatus Eisenbacteria bacterium]
MSRSLASLALASAALLFLGACGKKSTAPQGPTSHRFLLAWGTTGPGNGQFEFPAWVAVDDSAHVYVTESLGAVETGFQQRVQKFTSSGEFLASWDPTTVGDATFKAKGIAATAAGDLYVCGVTSVRRLSRLGVVLDQWGSAGTADGQFLAALAVAVDRVSGDFYVADTLQNRVQRFTSAGSFVRAWGDTGSADGQFQAPQGIVVDANQNVYVADTNNHRVQKFTHDGVWVKTWGTKGSAAGQFKYPGGIAVDADGNVYVTDSARGDNDLDLGNARVQVFTGTGTFVTQWDNGFGFPTGIGVDSGGNVYVADNLHDRIQKFSN